jgi:hypothetical protein
MRKGPLNGGIVARVARHFEGRVLATTASMQTRSATGRMNLAEIMTDTVVG